MKNRTLKLSVSVPINKIFERRRAEKISVKRIGNLFFVRRIFHKSFLKFKLKFKIEILIFAIRAKHGNIRRKIAVRIENAFIIVAVFFIKCVERHFNSGIRTDIATKSATFGRKMSAAKHCIRYFGTRMAGSESDKTRRIILRKIPFKLKFSVAKKRAFPVHRRQPKGVCAIRIKAVSVVNPRLHGIGAIIKIICYNLLLRTVDLIADCHKHTAVLLFLFMVNIGAVCPDIYPQILFPSIKHKLSSRYFQQLF